ncbi:unnamed protein product [Symbiodinium natans]|uniref:Uncharacterized protein n=1 Tax=Symbiodinium natans TaxID=878477 RepID=A0A812PZN3_9DINO|nr:unnamed protein product [Symbiodinium natans]
MGHGCFWSWLPLAQGSYLLTWSSLNTSAPLDIDIVHAKARGATESRGRLYFHRPARTRRAAGSFLAFRRLVREQSRRLPQLVVQPEYAGDLPCVPVWRRQPGSVAAFIHVAKSGGTAFRDALLRGPDAGGAAVRLQPQFPSESAVLNATSFAVGRLLWTYSKQNALETGSVGMVPKGELSWELQVPRLLAEAAHRLRRGARQKKEEAATVPCLCTLHFDFSIVQPLLQALPAGHVLGFAILRSPLQRYLSHFHFARQLDWTARLRIRQLSPVQYLYHPAALLDTLMVWQDGMAGTAWLSGLSVHVGAGSTRQESDNARMWAMFRNRTETLQSAVKNYHKLTFVGLLEDLDGSLRLLRTALRWARAPQVQHLNVGGRKSLRHEDVTEIERALRVLTPMDIWLYSYVRADFQARVAALDAGAVYCRAESDVPKVHFPSDDDLGGCIASRGAVQCGAEVFEGRDEKGG